MSQLEWLGGDLSFGERTGDAASLIERLFDELIDFSCVKKRGN